VVNQLAIAVPTHNGEIPEHWFTRLTLCMLSCEKRMSILRDSYLEVYFVSQNELLCFLLSNLKA